jgi:asparagine N-glycosylation enzyme membrane subunit Stt3
MARDEGLFRRVAATSLIVTVIAFCALTAYFPWPVGLSFVLGAATGLASLGTLDLLVRGLVAADAAGRQRRLLISGMLQVGKFALIAVAFYALFTSGAANGPALAAVVTLPTAVLCLKEAGRRVNRKLGVEEGPKEVNGE